MKRLLSTLVFLTHAAAWAQTSGSIALIDLDEIEVETRLAATVQWVLKDNLDSVQLRVCKDPLHKFAPDCGGDEIATPQISLSTFEERVKKFLGLNPAPDAMGILKDRAATLVWARDLFRSRIDKGITSRGKSDAELVLSQMAGRVDTNEEETRSAAQKVARELMQKLQVVSEDFSEIFFEETDRESYFAALSPFAPWLQNHICRCELSLGDSDEEPQCVIRKDGKSLSWSAASLGDCNSRRRCMDRNWYQAPDGKEKIDFDLLIKTQCDGYILPGSVADGLEPAVRKINKK